ncbi:MAG TPA: hypothetical protein VEU08_04950, partial [Vicinamibacterales bacterium]|nr:hypothetical protein [Vicinamibacterales bacterium]
PYVGSGVDTGVHGYAFTFVTAGGETLPSPTVNVTTGGGVPDPTTAPTIANAGSADLWGNGGGIIWQFSYSYSTGASNGDYTALTKVSPDSNQLTPNGTEINFSCPYSTDPGVTFIAIWFKRFDLGQGYHSDTSPAGRFVVANNSAGGTLSVTLSASGVSGNQNAPTSNTTATCNHVGLTSVSIGPVGVTSRKVYRTTAGGAQLKLVATIADNTTTTYTDSTADSGLGANVPTSDTSGLTQGAGQVVAGSTTIPVASVTAFVAALSGQTSGWAVIGNGQQFIKFTGTSGNTLTGVPASGIGAITATISYNSAITAAAQLTGIPTVGPTAISVTIPAGENARPCAQVDDVNAQATLAGYGFGDGVVEDKIDDASLTSYAAMNAAGNAFLSLFKAVDVQINPFASVDYKLVPGATVPVSIGAPTNINISALIQTVTTTRLSMPGTADSNGTIPFVYPLKTAQAGTARLTLAELLAQLALH